MGGCSVGIIKPDQRGWRHTIHVGSTSKRYKNGVSSEGALEEGEGVLVDRLLELALLGVGHVAPDREAVDGLSVFPVEVLASAFSTSDRQPAQRRR